MPFVIPSTPTSNLIRELRAPFATFLPTGIVINDMCVRDNGQLFYGGDNGRSVNMDSSGNMVECLSVPSLASILSCCAGQNGRVIVGSGIEILYSDNPILSGWTVATGDHVGMGNPTSMASDGLGNVVAKMSGDATNVYVSTNNGMSFLLVEVGEALHTYPSSISYDPRNARFLVCATNGRIRYSSNLTFAQTFIPPFAARLPLTVIASGGKYYYLTFDSRIYRSNDDFTGSQILDAPFNDTEENQFLFPLFSGCEFDGQIIVAGGTAASGLILNNIIMRFNGQKFEQLSPAISSQYSSTTPPVPVFTSHICSFAGKLYMPQHRTLALLDGAS